MTQPLTLIAFALYQAGKLETGPPLALVLRNPVFSVSASSYPIRDVQFYARAAFCAPQPRTVTADVGLAARGGPPTLSGQVKNVALRRTDANVAEGNFGQLYGGMTVMGPGWLDAVLVVDGKELARAPLYFCAPTLTMTTKMA
jgi:hypothetical protein